MWNDGLPKKEGSNGVMPETSLQTVATRPQLNIKLTKSGGPGGKQALDQPGTAIQSTRFKKNKKHVF